MVDREAIEEAIASIIVAIGDDPGREGLVDTPARVARMYADFFSGLTKDPAEYLATGFEEGHREMVILRDIPFFSMCEHHLLPFFGKAHVGYRPDGRVVGASKLARALDTLARRPQMQERLTSSLADAVFSSLKPEGVGTVLRAEHMCISLRGVEKLGAAFVTSAIRGSFRTRPETRSEFLSLVQGHV